MANVNIYALIMVMVIISLLGFCVENVFIGAMHGFMDNRNMVLPFLFGYGMAVAAIYLLFGTPTEPKFCTVGLNFSNPFLSTLYYFFIAFICVSVGEIILGHLIQYTCNIIWWDYSVIPLHITRYTSVPTSAGFALLITVFMKYFFQPLLKAFSSMNPKALAFLAIAFACLLSLDMLNSLLYMITRHNTLPVWRIEFKTSIKEMISKIAE